MQTVHEDEEMTVPNRQRLADVVRNLVPFMRDRLLPEEQELAVHIRGNEPLYKALVAVIEARIEGRANLPEPSDPIVCKSMVARDRECQFLLAQLDRIFHSPINPEEASSEQPD